MNPPCRRKLNMAEVHKKSTWIDGNPNPKKEKENNETKKFIKLSAFLLCQVSSTGNFTSNDLKMFYNQEIRCKFEPRIDVKEVNETLSENYWQANVEGEYKFLHYLDPSGDYVICDNLREVSEAFEERRMTEMRDAQVNGQVPWDILKKGRIASIKIKDKMKRLSLQDKQEKGIKTFLDTQREAKKIHRELEDIHGEQLKRASTPIIDDPFPILPPDALLQQEDFYNEDL